MRRGLPVSVISANENLTDIAGIRVICSFIEDIYMIADMLTSQTDVVLIRKIDYIKNPKPNGYHSLHLIVEIPVFFSNKKENVKVEIQIRTEAMDFWASLEHKLNYKSNNDEIISEKNHDLSSKLQIEIALTNSQLRNLFQRYKHNIINV